MGTLYIGILLLMKAAQGYFNKKASVLLRSHLQFLSFSLFNYAVCAALSLLYLLAAPLGKRPARERWRYQPWAGCPWRFVPSAVWRPCAAAR